MKTYSVQLSCGGVNVRVYWWGLALVTTQQPDEWVSGFRKHMFTSSRMEYWFLSCHLKGDWWWIGRSARNKLRALAPPEWRPGSGTVTLPAWELEHLQSEVMDTQLERLALAAKCFKMLSDGINSIPGKTVKKDELVEFLEAQRQSFARAAVEE